MTHQIPPDRRHLAAMLRVFARTGAHFGHQQRRDLLEYVETCEDTIEAQARMLRADLTEHQRLHAANASLRQLAEAALNLAQLDDRAAARPHLDTIRQALERTA